MASLVSWVVAHKALEIALAVAALDLVFALKPSWESNGLLHWVYLQLKPSA